MRPLNCSDIDCFHAVFIFRYCTKNSNNNNYLVNVTLIIMFISFYVQSQCCSVWHKVKMILLISQILRSLKRYQVILQKVNTVLVIVTLKQNRNQNLNLSSLVGIQRSMIQRHIRRHCINVMNVTGLMLQFLGCVVIFAQSILNILPVKSTLHG